MEIENQVLNFEQADTEELDAAWDRFKTLIGSCPGLTLTTAVLVRQFYRGLTVACKKEVHHACDRNLMGLLPDEIWKKIEDLATHNKLMGLETRSSCRNQTRLRS